MNSSPPGIHSDHESPPDDNEKDKYDNLERSSKEKDFVPLYAFSSKFVWLLGALAVAIILYLLIVILPHDVHQPVLSWRSKVLNSVSHLSNFVIVAVICLVMIDRTLIGIDNRRNIKEQRIIKTRDKKWLEHLKRKNIDIDNPPPK
jgi:hypothetical protein